MGLDGSSRRFFRRLLAAWLVATPLLVCDTGSRPAAAAPIRYLPITKYFVISRPEVTMKKTLEWEDEERLTPNNTFTEETLTFVSEIEAGTEGWVYHPALAIFDVELRPKWKRQSRQTTATGGGPTRNQKDEISSVGFTIDTTFLQYKPYTLNLFANSDRQDFTSSIAPDNVTANDTYRAKLSLDYWDLPTDIEYENKVTDFEGLTNFTTTTNSVRTRTTHRTDESDSTVRTEYREIDREQETATSSTENIFFSASNFYNFSDDMRLSSSMFAFDTSTKFSTTGVSDSTTSRNVTVTENLFLDHSRTLSSDYLGRAVYREDNGNDTTTLFGSGRLRHQLYENLETTFLATAQREDINEGDIENYETELNLKYRRRIPWGQVGLTNSYRLRLEDDNTKEGIRDVLDESHVLTGTTLAFLGAENIDTTTIVVTDAAGLVVFTQGPDYIVSTGGDTVAISRTGVGSTIADGATVLVDYQFLADGPFTLGNRTFQIGGDVSLWDTLSLFYQYSDSQDTLISGTRTSTLGDDITQIFGGEVRWRWSKTRGEYEDKDSTRDPLKRWMIGETLTFKPFRTLAVSMSATFTNSEFVDTGEKTEQIDGRFNLQWQPVRWGQFSVEATQRRTRGDIQETDETFAVSRFDWWFGLWNGNLKHEYLKQKDFLGKQNREQHLFLVEVDRRF